MQSLSDGIIIRNTFTFGFYVGNIKKNSFCCNSLIYISYNILIGEAVFFFYLLPITNDKSNRPNNTDIMYTHRFVFHYLICFCWIQFLVLQKDYEHLRFLWVDSKVTVEDRFFKYTLLYALLYIHFVDDNMYM